MCVLHVSELLSDDHVLSGGVVVLRYIVLWTSMTQLILLYLHIETTTKVHIYSAS